MYDVVVGGEEFESQFRHFLFSEISLCALLFYCLSRLHCFHFFLVFFVLCPSCCDLSHCLCVGEFLFSLLSMSLFLSACVLYPLPSACVLSISCSFEFCVAGGKVRLSACLSVLFVAFAGPSLSRFRRLLCVWLSVISG